MNKDKSSLMKTLLMAMMMFAVSACDSDDSALEKTGKKVDSEITDMGNKVEDICEDTKEGLNAKDTDC